jgi:hypothetical protein
LVLASWATTWNLHSSMPEHYFQIPKFKRWMRDKSLNSLESFNMGACWRYGKLHQESSFYFYITMDKWKLRALIFWALNSRMDIRDILQFHVLLWKLLKPNLGLKGNLEIYYIHQGFKT